MNWDLRELKEQRVRLEQMEDVDLLEYLGKWADKVKEVNEEHQGHRDSREPRAVRGQQVYLESQEKQDHQEKVEQMALQELGENEVLQENVEPLALLVHPEIQVNLELLVLTANLASEVLLVHQARLALLALRVYQDSKDEWDLQVPKDQGEIQDPLVNVDMTERMESRDRMEWLGLQDSQAHQEKRVRMVYLDQMVLLVAVVTLVLVVYQELLDYLADQGKWDLLAQWEVKDPVDHVENRASKDLRALQDDQVQQELRVSWVFLASREAKANKEDRAYLEIKDLLENLAKLVLLDPQDRQALQAETEQMDKRVQLENQDDQERMVFLDNPVKTARMANLAQRDLMADREILDLQDLLARKATEDQMAQLEPQARLEHQALRAKRETLEHQDKTDAVVNQDHRDHVVNLDQLALPEHQGQMVSMEQMVILVFLDALGLRENAAPQAIPGVLANLAQRVPRARKVMLVHLASKEKRDGVDWMVLQEDQENQEFRARQDPEVKKEKLDLPERKETRAGLVDLDYRDPRVHRVTRVPPEQTEWTALLDLEDPQEPQGTQAPQAEMAPRVSLETKDLTEIPVTQDHRALMDTKDLLDHPDLLDPRVSLACLRLLVI